MPPRLEGAWTEQPLFFVSDLHLSGTAPRRTQTFLHFCASLAQGTGALFVLGDLFDYWIHWRQIDESPATEVLPALAELTRRGIRVYCMPGNRDFALTASVLERFGVEALADPSILLVAREAVLLTHGDLLCTDDAAYLRFRRVIRNPLLLGFLRALPYPMLQGLARGLRRRSQRAVAQKDLRVTDASAEGLRQAFLGQGPFAAAEAPFTRLIHGHTHRPGQQDLPGLGQRLVLGDWCDDGACLVRHDHLGWHLRHFPRGVDCTDTSAS